MEGACGIMAFVQSLGGGSGGREKTVVRLEGGESTALGLSTERTP